MHEFEIARSISELLAPLPPGQRERILRWVQEYLKDEQNFEATEDACDGVTESDDQSSADEPAIEDEFSDIACERCGNLLPKARLDAFPEVKKCVDCQRIVDEQSEEDDVQLFEQLRRLRLRLAALEGLPAYFIFANSALDAMVSIKPKNIDEFMAIKGVGPSKAEKYGLEFLEAIARFVNTTSTRSHLD